MTGLSQFLFNDNINIYLQSFGNSTLDTLFKVITDIGSEPSYLFLASLIFWCFGKKAGMRSLYIILFSASAAIFAKNLFAIPRPPEYLHKVNESDFGFPSGHAFISSGFWGYLGGRFRKSWLIFAGIVAISFISLSRLYLGVHYLGDVVGGIIFGLILALIFFKFEKAITDRFKSLGRMSRYFVALIPPAALIALAILQGVEMEEEGFAMSGIGIGFLLEEERAGFSDATGNRQRIKRAIIGTALLGLIYSISTVLMLINPDFIFFRDAALGFASTFIAPLVMSKIELNQKAT